MMPDQNPEPPQLPCQSAEATRRLTRAEASRINGARSRGPKTEEGKRRSSRNAVTHGLTSSLTPAPVGLIDNGTTCPVDENQNGKEDHTAASFLLSNEDSAIYNRIRAICVTGLKPSDEFEWELVGEIAITRFLARRIYSTEARLFDRAMYEDAEEFGKEQQLYGAAETERLAAALEHAPNVQKVAGLMRRYDTQISRKFHSLLDQLRRYRADKRRYAGELEPGPEKEDSDPDHSGGGGSVTTDGSQNPAHERDKSDEHHSALAAQPAVPRGAASIWTAGICTSVVAVSWSAGTCTSLQNDFAARRSRSQRASANEGIASAPPSRE